jgi:transposase, IS5 family
MSIREENRQKALFETDIERLVKAEHPLRKLLKAVDFEELSSPLKPLWSKTGRGGYSPSQVLKMLVLQFMDDLSDRALERYLEDNNAAKYFCGFRLLDTTPDFSSFNRMRDRIGLHRLAQIFNRVRDSMKKAGVIREVFTFVDASSLKSRVDTWVARDKVLEDAKKSHNDDNPNPPSLNNTNMGQYSSDPHARFGCKGKDKYWIGYKRNVSVDMSSGMINKVSITMAHITDQKAVAQVLPNQGMVFGDKAYCLNEAQRAMKQHNCHSGAILKNNMKGKDFRKDAWLTSVRMPYEGTFASLPKVTRFRGLNKNKFLGFFQALGFNLKRWIRITEEPLILVPA